MRTRSLPAILLSALAAYAVALQLLLTAAVAAGSVAGPDHLAGTVLCSGEATPAGSDGADPHGTCALACAAAYHAPLATPPETAVTLIRFAVTALVRPAHAAEAELPPAPRRVAVPRAPPGFRSLV